ncbi:Uncharacterised protein g4673 [Pycnogonum litorale]
MRKFVNKLGCTALAVLLVLLVIHPRITNARSNKPFNRLVSLTQLRQVLQPIINRLGPSSRTGTDAANLLERVASQINLKTMDRSKDGGAKTKSVGTGANTDDKRLDEEDFDNLDFDDIDFKLAEKRQYDDYGHMRFGRSEVKSKGKRYDDYGHLRFGR